MNDPYYDEDLDEDQLDELAGQLQAAATGDIPPIGPLPYPETMVEGYGVTPDDEEPEKSIVVVTQLTYRQAARLLARERGVDQLDVYDHATTLAVLNETVKRAVDNDLDRRQAEDAWYAHLEDLAESEHNADRAG